MSLTDRDRKTIQRYLAGDGVDRGVSGSGGLLEVHTVLSVNGDSYRMRAHQAAIASLRPAITGGELS